MIPIERLAPRAFLKRREPGLGIMVIQCIKCLLPCLPRQQEHTADRWVLSTGCDSGFGQRLVRDARASGFNVVAACYMEQGQESLATNNASSPTKNDSTQEKEALMNHSMGDLITVVADLTTAHGITKVVEAVKAAVKDQELWAIVNNAGICLPGNVHWMQPESYYQTFEVNFFAPVKLTYELLPLLKESKGRVVNVTSVDGFIPLPSNASYNASKHALEAYSDTLRCEMLPWGVKVVVVEPSTMKTPLVMAYADSWLKGFKASPKDRQDCYGDAWAQEFAERTKTNLDGPAAADPSLGPLYALLGHVETS